MKITVDPSLTPVMFRFVAEDGQPVSLLEIRVTEVGEEEPSWWVFHQDATLAEAVNMHILTPEEAEHPASVIQRNFEQDMDEVISAFGIPVTEVRYGVVPEGFRQEGTTRPLKKHRLYQLLAMGRTLGELEFYG